MAEKHSAPLTSSDAFFHGLGHGQAFCEAEGNDR